VLNVASYTHTQNLIVCSIELFQSTCDELGEWIKDKEATLGTEDVANDLKSIEALQRKHAVSQS